ncbi:MAG: isoleucine--tRNA ligase, partial [Atopobiaceae bacterium]|nr:isoleucine--tRNA ligase [Atopobiaceae bacterium]
YAALLDWWVAPMDEQAYAPYLPVYAAVVEARAAFTKSYEDAIGSGAIAEKTTQAARAELVLPAEQYGLLTGELGCDLAEPFVCSEVIVAQGDELSCSAVPAQGDKCERCWNWREVGDDHLCHRCHDAVEAYQE